MSMFKFVEQQVREASKQIAKQATVAIQQEVTAPLRRILLEVKDSNVWTGKGANRFINVMEYPVLPQLEKLIGSITSVSARIDKGAERMQQAIEEADKKAMTLFALFTGIF